MTWVDVGSATLPDGTVFAAHVGETQLAVARVDDEWHAVETWCTHAECPLSDGWVDGRALRCACHGALFDLVTGDPLEGPASAPIRVFETRVASGRIEVDV